MSVGLEEVVGLRGRGWGRWCDLDGLCESLDLYGADNRDTWME